MGYSLKATGNPGALWREGKGENGTTDVTGSDVWAVFEEGYFKAGSSVRTLWGRCVLEILGFYVLLPCAASMSVCVCKRERSQSDAQLELRLGT